MRYLAIGFGYGTFYSSCQCCLLRVFRYHTTIKFSLVQHLHSFVLCFDYLSCIAAFQGAIFQSLAE